MGATNSTPKPYIIVVDRSITRIAFTLYAENLQKSGVIYGDETIDNVVKPYLLDIYFRISEGGRELIIPVRMGVDIRGTDHTEISLGAVLDNITAPELKILLQYRIIKLGDVDEFI